MRRRWEVWERGSPTPTEPTSTRPALLQIRSETLLAHEGGVGSCPAVARGSRRGANVNTDILVAGVRAVLGCSRLGRQFPRRSVRRGGVFKHLLEYALYTCHEYFECPVSLVRSWCSMLYSLESSTADGVRGDRYYPGRVPPGLCMAALPKLMRGTVRGRLHAQDLMT
jgi:hypothetical protein